VFGEIAEYVNGASVGWEPGIALSVHAARWLSSTVNLSRAYFVRDTEKGDGNAAVWVIRNLIQS
jgi:hypothetical protein